MQPEDGGIAVGEGPFGGHGEGGAVVAAAHVADGRGGLSVEIIDDVARDEGAQLGVLGDEIEDAFDEEVMVGFHACGAVEDDGEGRREFGFGGGCEEGLQDGVAFGKTGVAGDDGREGHGQGEAQGDGGSGRIGGQPAAHGEGGVMFKRLKRRGGGDGGIALDPG